MATNTMSDIDECLNFIASLNDKMEIYVLSVYSMIEQKTLRTIASPLYSLYNQELQKVCAKYDHVHYVDISKTRKFVAPQDNHPTFTGQQHIAKQIIKTMQQN